MANEMSGGATVKQVTFDLLRSLGMTTVFGNPGSTELAFLDGWPADFRYVLGLQEASVVGMADGYAQATGRAALVNLHSAAGVGNALGNIFTAHRNRAPMVITAGQQARSILPYAPYLGADRAAEFPQPYVKWSCEPARAEDVPTAILQAHHIAMQKPWGPTFVSIPSDDWGACATPPIMRRVAGGVVPDPAEIAGLAKAIAGSRNPALVVGPEIDRDGAFDLAVELAERAGMTVWEAPTASRASFPEDHPRFAGFLPAMPDALSKRLSGHDLIVVIGAPVFTFHVPGEAPLFASGTPIYQITDDPLDAARTRVATSLVGTMRLSIQALLGHFPAAPAAPPARPAREPAPEAVAATPIPIDYTVQTLARTLPDDAIVVEEAPSHRPAIQRYLPIRKAGGFHTMASGGLGYGLPAAVGVALARQTRTVCVIGDGSAMYSFQALWTAVQHGLPVTVLVLNNAGYGAMRAFSAILNSTAVPGIDLPGIDFVTLAAGLGCPGVRVQEASALAEALTRSIGGDGPFLVEIAVDPATGTVY